MRQALFILISSNLLEVVNGDGTKFYPGYENKNYCKYN